MKKIIALFLIMLMSTQITPITESADIIKLYIENINENQSIPKYCFTGILIGRITDLDRICNKYYISCQAVSIYYNGIVIIRPPHAIDELKGRLNSGEIKIYRSYIGIITRNYIFAWINADSEIFYSNGNNLPQNLDFGNLQNDISFIKSIVTKSSINPNISRLPVKSKLVETTVRIYKNKVIIPYTVKLTEKKSDEVDRIFDNIKFSLDTAGTDGEIDEIFNDATVSLYELGLFPKGMTIEKAQQLITFKNLNPIATKTLDNIKTVDENFNCLIAGITSYAEFFKPGWEIFLTRIKFIKTLVNGIISFGDEHWEWGGGSGDYFCNPASGWVWTKGSNGVKTWEGNSLWGNLGSYYYMGGWPYLIWYEYWYYQGATGFTGISIRGFPNDRFFGYASHVAITTEFPG